MQYDSIIEYLNNKNMIGLKQILNDSGKEDILNVFYDLSNKDQVIVYRLLSKDMALDIFEELDTDEQQNLLRSFTDEQAIEAINELAPDDRVRLLDELPAMVAKKFLAGISSEERVTTNLLMGYEAQTAGRIMTPEFVHLHKGITAGAALEVIKAQAVEKETIYTIYIVDAKGVLEGVISLRALLIAAYDTKVEDIMETISANVSTSTDQEEVAKLLQKMDWLAVPVVDKENRLVGIVTIDDAIDILQQETTEDFAKMSAITPINKSYDKISVWEIVKARSPWLLVLMVSATFTHMVIEMFEAALEVMPVLYAAIPMLMDTAGNAGTQSSTTIVRAMSLNEVQLKNILYIMWKEIRVAVYCGIILAIANFGRMLFFTSANATVALVVSITLVMTVFVAKAIGSALPLLAERIKLDPAVMSATVVTTIADVLALIVYFNIARALLNI